MILSHNLTIVVGSRLKGSVIIKAHDPGAETLNVIQQYAKRYNNNAHRE